MKRKITPKPFFETYSGSTIFFDIPKNTTVPSQHVLDTNRNDRQLDVGHRTRGDVA